MPKQAKKISDDVPAQWAHLAVAVDGSGFYERADADGLEVGTRPGFGQYGATAVACIFALGVLIVLSGAGLWWLGLPLALLFAAGGIAISGFRQSTRVSPGRLHVFIRQLGLPWSNEWELPADSRLRVKSYPRQVGKEVSTLYMAEIVTADGWVPLVSSASEEQVREYAERLATATGAVATTGRAGGPNPV
jgi:hypothetical protein